jgi:hypothetical protein
MRTLLAWIFGSTSLLAAIVLAVIAIGQAAFGTGAAFVPTLIVAVGAFGVAWVCSRHIKSALAAELKRLDVAPDPVPVPEGELVLRMSWDKWLLATVAFSACTAAGLFCVAAAAGAWKLQALLVGVAIVAVLAPMTLLLLETGRRSLDLGGLARLDAQGFRHCLLPVVPWRRVRGVDLELQVVRSNIKQWFLVLAVDRELAPALCLAWWWRSLGPGAPRVDDAGRLTVPLAYVRGRPQDVVGRAMAVADRWGAQRIPGWRSYLDPDTAASMHAARVSSDEAVRTVERVVQQLRQRISGESFTPAESGRMMAEAKRSMDELDRTFEEQMKSIRSGVRK